MYRLVPALVREMGQAYPELVRAEALITETLKLEETRFRKHAGARPRPARRGDRATLRHGDMLDGETAFKLYDTYGFPLDLTQDALRQRGITVDHRRLRRRHGASRRPRRASSWAGSGEAATETVWFGAARAGRRHRVPRLRHRDRREGIVLALVKDGAVVDERRRGRRRSRSSSTRRRSTANPAARSATPARSSRRGLLDRASPTRRRRPDGLFVHVGKVVEGRGQDAARPSSSRSTTRAARGCAPTIRPPTCCTRRCARCSARMSRRRARWSRPSACASTSRTTSRSRRRNWRRSSAWPTRSSSRTAR